MKYLPSKPKLEKSEKKEDLSKIKKDYINFTKIFDRIILMNSKNNNTELKYYGFNIISVTYINKIRTELLTKLIHNNDKNIKKIAFLKIYRNYKFIKGNELLTKLVKDYKIANFSQMKNTILKEVTKNKNTEYMFVVLDVIMFVC